jgi:3-methyladenine DNA glycosylase Mpg
MRYLTDGTRVSVQAMRYDPTTQKYKRNGQTERVSVENAKEADALWRFIVSQIRLWKARAK